MGGDLVPRTIARTTITGHLPIPGASDGHQHAVAAN